MKLSIIFHLLRKNLFILIFFPALLAALVLYKTKDEQLEYSSSFLVYTGLASGYNLNTEEHPRLDHNAVNNAFDNLLTTLKARETIEEVGIRLLALHIRLDKADARYITTENYKRLQKLMPDSIEVKVKKASSIDDAINILYQYQYASGNNAVKDFMDSGYEVYGTSFISGKLIAKRKDFSDMMEVTYTAYDPAVCQQTLIILSEVFLRRYKDLKQGEINNVVTYFDQQTQNALTKLRNAQEELKNFEIKNKIINYDQETKTISQSKQDLLNSIEKEKLLQSASEATIKNLESKIDMQKGLMETNKKILEKRKQLADLNYKIANSQMYDGKAAELSRIKEEADNLKEEIRLIVSDLYKINTSTDGLPRNDLLTQWLNNFLIIDESKARIQMMQLKLNDYDAMYNRYAPLGANLSRLKRDIEVAEKEYLDHLSALNINKQRKQNIDMSSTIKIVDKPYYPLQPKPSKRMLMVAGSFIAGFAFFFVMLMGKELLDNSIRTVKKAEELTELKVLGLLPFVKENEKRFDVFSLESGLLEQSISGLVLEINNRKGSTSKSRYIMVSSVKSGEGKDWCAYRLASKFTEVGKKVLLLHPYSIKELKSEEFKLRDQSLELVSYTATNDLINKENPEQLLSNRKIDFDSYDYIFLIIPSLIENQLPVGLLKKMDITLLVLNAERKWNETDDNISRLYRQASIFEPVIILNKVSYDTLLDIYGELPKYDKKKKLNKGGQKSNPSEDKPVIV